MHFNLLLFCILLCLVNVIVIKAVSQVGTYFQKSCLRVNEL